MRNYQMITQLAKGNAIIQGCALRKIKGSRVVLTCETLGAQHVICIKKLRFSIMKFFQLLRYGNV